MDRPTEYDARVTDDYAALFNPQSPFGWLSNILEYRAFSLVPRDREVAVLDLACGIGSLCGRLASHGFSDVVGTDISPSQIETARRTVGSSVRFEVADARTTHTFPGFRGRFDVVNASWLYDTATDFADALAMARSAHACLRPGGWHQGIELNPGIRASNPFELVEFGIALMPDLPPGSRPRDGEGICADLLVEAESGRTLRTHVTYFNENSLRRILVKAGFRNVVFHPPAVWPLAAGTPTDTVRKFARYIATNPEMISFIAMA